MKITMASKVISKKETQEMINALKRAKLPVKKIEGGYTLTDKHGTVLFKAMTGSNGYLVRYAQELFV